MPSLLSSAHLIGPAPRHLSHPDPGPPNVPPPERPPPINPDNPPKKEPPPEVVPDQPPIELPPTDPTPVPTRVPPQAGISTQAIAVWKLRFSEPAFD